MAHFRGEVIGTRGTASRLGHKSTGIRTRLQTYGWNVEVWAEHNEETEENTAGVWLIHSRTGERRPVADLNLTTGENITGSNTGSTVQ